MCAMNNLLKTTLHWQDKVKILVSNVSKVNYMQTALSKHLAQFTSDTWHGCDILQRQKHRIYHKFITLERQNIN